MLPAFIVWILMLLAIFLSIRISRRYYRSNSYSMPNSDVSLTPVSIALSNLVGIAGGIYLSVVLLFNFLKIPVPEPRLILGCTVDPLAFISLWVAILQPIILRIYQRLRYHR